MNRAPLPRHDAGAAESEIHRQIQVARKHSRFRERNKRVQRDSTKKQWLVGNKIDHRRSIRLDRIMRDTNQMAGGVRYVRARLTDLAEGDARRGQTGDIARTLVCDGGRRHITFPFVAGGIPLPR